ncbi:hypothetical protein GCM10025868_35650 [Angustibacter aerolatus]|uniref:Gamma-glutamylcyclotransferase AIG2-like domain-containing protein n=1 Tax=Angustibacter aerolatus TaxID=1162965 RepID=A0ABQ6JNI9_9ACTN|nr:gamma-glutamylcyclotransferase family protein [Angustibacter aerolatus]GMA88315.1 hypothetical protein GCM10025868_35650 [Angustibacter aerolatus]
MALYAAYGTNLDASRMLRLAPHSPTRGTGWLSGWRLTFAGEDIGWDGPKATIVEDPTSQVYVALYDVTPADEETMDEFERAVLGGATKIRLRVHTLDGDPLAWVYVMDAYEGGLPTASLPRRAWPRPPRWPAPPTTTWPTCARAPAARTASAGRFGAHPAIRPHRDGANR